MVSQALEPLVKPFSDITKVPIDAYTIDTFGELGGSGVELLTGLTMTPLGSKLTNFFGGIVGLGAAAFAPIGDREKRELVSVVNHMISRLVDPSPEVMAKLQSDIQTFIAGLQTGNFALVQQSLLRTPGEVQNALAGVAAIFGVRRAPAPLPPPPGVPPVAPTGFQFI